jgi:hypothetical protein
VLIFCQNKYKCLYVMNKLVGELKLITESSWYLKLMRWDEWRIDDFFRIDLIWRNTVDNYLIE